MLNCNPYSKFITVLITQTLTLSLIPDNGEKVVYGMDKNRRDFAVD
jgi:hypothetical protein